MRKSEMISFFVTYFVSELQLSSSSIKIQLIVVFFPNSKINLGLNIVNKRSDGYHDIETVFLPIPLKDALEVIQTTDDNQRTTVKISESGINIVGKAEDNLCVKAFNLLKKDFPFLSNVQMHLHKAIPVGAGLGGGSSDGAFTLKLLNKKFELNISEKQLSEYSLQLGSDCPFFILNKPCFATSRGEILEQIALDLSEYKIVVVHPSIHISTAWAFTNIKPRKPVRSIKQIISQPILTWKEELINDFEKPVFAKYPEIKRIKEELYNSGSEYASMSGSGSGVYGIFRKEKAISLSFPKNYFVKTLFS